MTIRQTRWLGGFIADLPTPFDSSGQIDWSALENLCERQIAAGSTAIVVGETTGEAATLSREEHQDLIAAVTDIAGGSIAVIAGAGSNATAQAIDLAAEAQIAGADAILSVVPYYNKPTQAGLLAHFRSIAAATDLPIIVHDAPARTMRAMADETLAALAQSTQFIGMLDATASLTRLSRLRSMLPQEFRLLSGDDATALAYIASGGDGCISMAANLFPDLCYGFDAGRRTGFSEIMGPVPVKFASLGELLAQDAPAALKYALSLSGDIRPDVRLPLVELPACARSLIAAAVASLNVYPAFTASCTAQDRSMFSANARAPSSATSAASEISRPSCSSAAR